MYFFSETYYCFWFFPETNLAVTVRNTIPGNPKNTIPILAARGSPSNVELTAQAIENRMRSIPIISPVQGINPNRYFFERLTTKYILPINRKPRKYHIKFIIILFLTPKTFLMLSDQKRFRSQKLCQIVSWYCVQNQEQEHLRHPPNGDARNPVCCMGTNKYSCRSLRHSQSRN